MSDRTPAIVVEDLVKVYKEKSSSPVRALDGLSLHVNAGEVFGLLGPNGAGKTTLLRILTTLTRPTSGHVQVLGYDLIDHGLEIRRKICVVLQENSVELFLSVWDNLLTYARFHSIPTHKRKERARRVIEQFGLDDVANQKLIDLSGGLKRRVQVAKVFMIEKPLVFLDEATTGMDPINKRATLDAIREQSRLGRTIFLTTHILHEAEELCDSIAIVNKGRCVACGDLNQIKALVERVFDISITFDSISDSLLNDLQCLPLIKFTRNKNTVEMSVKGEEFASLELLSTIAKGATVQHIEVTSATLEDVFVSLLGGSRQ
jgi:ABC-2 type transport system ATP-binding protein